MEYAHAEGRTSGPTTASMIARFKSSCVRLRASLPAHQRDRVRFSMENGDIIGRIGRKIVWSEEYQRATLMGAKARLTAAKALAGR